MHIVWYRTCCWCMFVHIQGRHRLKTDQPLYVECGVKSYKHKVLQKYIYLFTYTWLDLEFDRHVILELSSGWYFLLLRLRVDSALLSLVFYVPTKLYLYTHKPVRRSYSYRHWKTTILAFIDFIIIFLSTEGICDRLEVRPPSPNRRKTLKRTVTLLNIWRQMLSQVSSFHLTVCVAR